MGGLSVLPAAAQQPDLRDDGRSIALAEAIERALARNDDIVIERLNLDSAESAIQGAEGAYDPLLGLEAGWRRTTPPVASTFSGAPEGEIAPTEEAATVGGSLVQLLPSGGTVAVRAGNARTETNGAFDLLSPYYDSRLGVELRQPILRNRRIDPARLALRVASADRDRAAASLEREVLDTVAAVERAYWDLVAARRAVSVRQEAIELASRQLEQTEIRIEGGALPEAELAQPRAELERRRGELLETLEAVYRAENALKLLILGDSDEDAALWTEPLAPSDDIEVETRPVDLGRAMADALALRPELDAFEALVELRRAETAFAKDGVKPALDLVASYDRFGLAGSPNDVGGIPGFPGADVPRDLDGNFGDSVEQLVDGDFEDARVALVFEIPIGNRSARARAAIAEDEERRAEAQLSRARKVIRADVLDAAAAVDSARARIEAAQADDHPVRIVNPPLLFDFARFGNISFHRCVPHSYQQFKRIT
jgi:HAE1 family hydrophobic/amphiphilic exporter-1